jgi:hypothetical protein
MSEDPPIGSDHPIDSDIPQVHIGHGFEPTDEPWLSHTGSACESGGPTEVAMNGGSDKTTAWKLESDGAIHSVGEIPGIGLEVHLMSPCLYLHDEMDLGCDWSVNITVDTVTETGAPYLYVEFGGPQTGTHFRLTEDQRAAFEKALKTGETTDAITAQGELVEDVLCWFDQEWVEGLNYDMFCRLERQRLGIGEDDIAWEEPGLAGYGSDQHAVRVYRAPDDRFLVCYEALSKPTEWGHTEPFALITREQFEDVPDDPYNAQATHRAFLEAAAMIREEWA